MAKILLVEDSPTQAIEMTMLLESAHHEVVHAANGKLGLEELRRQSPDLVITDLEMPEMNGLDLVRSMHMDFAHVPSILVTSHGSEDLAAEALRQGAAGYVPKNRMNDLLNDAIVDVLGVMRTDASFERLVSTLRENLFVFDLPNDPILITPLVGLLAQVSSGMELLPSIEMVRLGVAVEHAVANAMCHGNLELSSDECPRHREMIREGKLSEVMSVRMRDPAYKRKTVHVSIRACLDEVRVTVRDQGKGFDTSTAPQPGQIDPRVMIDEDAQMQGKGLVLMASFVDELAFNDPGNEVTLVKRVRKL